MSTDTTASATTGRDNGRRSTPKAEPVGFSMGPDGATVVEVHLTARDLNGNVLFDEMGGHIFRIENGLIRRFDIR